MRVGPGIELPRDQFEHIGAPKEWWWHTGTLWCGDRRFGFEINLSGVSDWDPPYQYAELMITDVQEKKHYQFTGGQFWEQTWAQSNPDNPWFVRMSGNAHGGWRVEMTSHVDTPFTMNVSTQFSNGINRCAINLTMEQNAPPLLVWGTGVKEFVPTAPTPLSRNNYYYSFTKLDAHGEIEIDGVTYPVQGMTWMDHEYGAFATNTKWILQDAQLSNGYHLSNYATNEPVVEGVRIKSHVTILEPMGDSIFVESFVTPVGPVWVAPDKTAFCMTMIVEIPAFDVWLKFESLMPDQQFRGGGVYEGVAAVTGRFGSVDVTGTGWIEQMLAAPKDSSILAKVLARR